MKTKKIEERKKISNPNNQNKRKSGFLHLRLVIKYLSTYETKFNKKDLT